MSDSTPARSTQRGQGRGTPSQGSPQSAAGRGSTQGSPHSALVAASSLGRGRGTPSTQARGRGQGRRWAGLSPGGMTGTISEVSPSASPVRASLAGAYAYRDPLRSSSVQPDIASAVPPMSPSQQTAFRMAAPPGNVGDQNIWGTTVNVATYQSAFRDFLTAYGADEGATGEGTYIVETRLIVGEGQKDVSISLQHIKEHEIAENDETRPISSIIESYPVEALLLSDLVLNDVGKGLDLVGESDPPLTCRFFGMSEQSRMRDLGPEHVDKLVSLTGMVARVSKIIPQMRTAIFRCVECQHYVPSFLDRQKFIEPRRCTSCGGEWTFSLIHNLSAFQSSQIMRLQEDPEAVAAGSTPAGVTVVLWDSMVDCVMPGDRIELTGIYRVSTVRQSQRSRVTKSVYKTYINAVHVKRFAAGSGAADLGADEIAPGWDDGHGGAGENDPGRAFGEDEVRRFIEVSKTEDIYKVLVRSLAPSVWGMSNEKKGLLCLLFGGRSKTTPSLRVRGEINMLLCGDPGVAKSQLLKFVHRIAPRGVYTTGKGTSGVGLTASVTRDPDTNDVILDSGALVLSDRGVCCIDEFDKMRDDTRSILHEAMEQQTVSVAKAGIVTSLNARTSVLAAANPVDSRWALDKSVPDNLQMEPTLISRFDLVFLLIDEVNTETDKKLADHIISLYNSPEERERKRTEERLPLIPLPLLTRYIRYARMKVHPIITEEAKGDIVSSYIQLRRTGSDKTYTATPRQLESLIRLAEALARMRLSNDVTRDDVKEAARLIHTALRRLQERAPGEDAAAAAADVVDEQQEPSQREGSMTVDDLLSPSP